MRVVDLLLETASSYNANRVRSSIVVIGIVIGITVIVCITAILGGVKVALLGEEGASQVRLVEISCTYERSLSYTDVTDMAKQLDDVFEVVMPSSEMIADVSTPTKEVIGQVEGVHYEHASALNVSMLQGRFLTQKEYDGSDTVVVLDDAGVKTLFGSTDQNVVGQKLNIDGADYEVVGVVNSEGATSNDKSIKVYMPFTTCARRLARDTEANELLAIARENVEPEKAAYEAEKWISDRLKISEDDREYALNIRTMKTFTDRVNTVTDVMQKLSILMSSVALFVGGIGVMEIMLTNVAERNREIGIRKALGASRRDITMQFLLESVGLTFGGGVLGTVIGFLLSFGLAGVAGAIVTLGDGMTIVPTLEVNTILLVAGICISIGVVFGCYPAYRAGKLDPVEPLRYQ